MAELQLVVATCHKLILSVDHVGENTKILGTRSALENIRLHWKKCSLLLKSVVASSMKGDIVNRIKGKKFCILADKPTDISCEKHICIGATFFDEKLIKWKLAFRDWFRLQMPLVNHCSMLLVHLQMVLACC